MIVSLLNFSSTGKMEEQVQNQSNSNSSTSNGLSQHPLPEQDKVKPSKMSLVDHYRDTLRFSEFDELLEKYQPLDLALGAPDFNPPKKLQVALAKAVISDDYKLNQYTLHYGYPRLLKAISTFFSRFFDEPLSPTENVVVTVGATACLYAILQAHTLPGDEWIVFEPCYFMFGNIIRAAQGVTRCIPLQLTKTTGRITSSDFKFDREILKKLFNHKTKGILLNTPHNPTGKVFTREELTFIADLAKKWDIIVIVDEIYQFMNYDDKECIRLATFPGMFERTINVNSVGKLFAATGYRIGWAYGPKNLIDNIKEVHRTMVVSAPATIQDAVAVMLEDEMENYGHPDSFIQSFRRECETKRNYIYDILSEAGMMPILPESGFFIVANWTTMVSGVDMNETIDECNDYTFVKWLIKNVNVYGIPMSSSYIENKHLGKNYVRFTLVKANETIQELERLLKRWKSTKQNYNSKLVISASNDQHLK